LFALIVTPSRIDQVRDSVTQYADVVFEHDKELDSAATRASLDAVSRVAADTLVLDIDIGPGSDIVTGLRNYRIARPQARVIILAADREPGDQVLNDIVKLGVYDILNDSKDADWTELLSAMLKKPPATFAEAVRWINAYEQENKNHQVIIERRPIGMIYIAVAGVGAGIGCTHVAFSIASFLSRRKHSVALLEACPRPGLGEMVRNLNAKKSKNESWRVGNIDTYPLSRNEVNFNKETWRLYESNLSKVKGKYEYLVTDIGELNSETKVELLRASVPVVVASAAPWRFSQLQSLNSQDDFELLLNQPNEKNIKRLTQLYNMGAFILPHVADPGNPTEADQVFSELLSSVLPQQRKPKSNLISMLKLFKGGKK